MDFGSIEEEAQGFPKSLVFANSKDHTEEVKMTMNSEIDVFRTLQVLFGNGEDEIRKGSVLVGSLYEHIFENMSWCKELPYLQFPAHWQVKITPPFVGAIIRFRVKKATTPQDESISIYFDGYNNLGICSGPYWEIFPNCEDDNARFLLGDEKTMFEEIEKALDFLERRNVEDGSY